MALANPRGNQRKQSRRQRLRAVEQQPKVRVDDQVRRFGQCRSMGHQWRHTGRIDEIGTGVKFGSVGLRSVCEYCDMERIKWLSRSGETHTRYQQPEGYGTHGDDRKSAREWRASFFLTIEFGD